MKPEDNPETQMGFIERLVAAGVLAPDDPEVGPPPGTATEDQPGIDAPPGDATAAAYALSALAAEAETVATATEGERNHTLNRAAYKIGGYVGAKHLDGDYARDVLTEAAQRAGLGVTEARRTARSGTEAGATRPRGVRTGQARDAAVSPARNGHAHGRPRVQPSRTLYEDELERQRARRAAKRTLDREEQPPVVMPEAVTLTELLAQPPEPVTYRIEGWLPVGARVILAAQYKAGKTTLTGNLVRSLVDGAPFLDGPPTTPVSGTVAVLDFEMSSAQLVRWLADQGIAHDEAVLPISLRGKASAFDILDPDSDRFGEWVTLLTTHNVGYVVLDCLRPVLDVLGLDEHNEAGRFLVAFDQLLTTAGITEACLVHHMGHGGERSRGDSRIRDWPDVEWRLVREDIDNPASARYLSAIGRDVDQPEQRLDFNSLNRHLVLAGGSRWDTHVHGALSDIVDFLSANPRQSMRAVEKAMAETDHTQRAVRAALKLGVHEGTLFTERGPRGATLHSSASVRQTASPVRRRSERECVSAFIENAHAHAHAYTLTESPSRCLECDRSRPVNPNTRLCAACTDGEGERS